LLLLKEMNVGECRELKDICSEQFTIASVNDLLKLLTVRMSLVLFNKHLYYQLYVVFYYHFTWFYIFFIFSLLIAHM